MSYVRGKAWKEIYGQRKDEMPKDAVFSLLTPSGAQSKIVATFNRRQD